jgi:DNA-binding NtrC family response regulator
LEKSTDIMKRRILIIETDEGIRGVLEEMLKDISPNHSLCFLSGTYFVSGCVRFCGLIDLAIIADDFLEIINEMKRDGYCGKAILISAGLPTDGARTLDLSNYDCILDKPLPNEETVRQIVSSFLQEEALERAMDVI